jgi:hypothetical protein
MTIEPSAGNGTDGPATERSARHSHGSRAQGARQAPGIVSGRAAAGSATELPRRRQLLSDAWGIATATRHTPNSVGILPNVEIAPPLPASHRAVAADQRRTSEGLQATMAAQGLRRQFESGVERLDDLIEALYELLTESDSACNSGRTE